MARRLRNIPPDLDPDAPINLNLSLFGREALVVQGLAQEYHLDFSAAARIIINQWAAAQPELRLAPAGEEPCNSTLGNPKKI
ncbi:MAG TPA: hypothetical protein VF813_10335 [Anaerolineaceae bacterium]